jgi:hypothetical protein
MTPENQTAMLDVLRQQRDLLKEILAALKERPASGGKSFTGWRAFAIPFGKQQGKLLGELPSGSLAWWIENYQPKPYKGSISEKDAAFRAALDAAKGDVPERGTTHESAPADRSPPTDSNKPPHYGTDENVPF